MMTQSVGPAQSRAEMFTSFLGKQHLSTRSARQAKREANIKNASMVPTREELASEMQTPGYLKIGQRLLQGNAVVSHL